MLYNTIVEKNDSGLMMIIDAAKKFDEDRFLEGIQQRCYTAADIQQLTDRLRGFQGLLNTEARALVAFSETFLQEFATDNNKCFETAELLFNRIRSTICATRKVFKKTCPIIRRQQPRNVERPSAYVRSVFSHGVCNRDLFGILSFDEAVQTLYAELQAFFTTVIQTLGLCHYMIMKERDIMEDGARCAQIYRNCERKMIDSVKEMTRFLDSLNELPDNELANRKANARSNEEFCKENYHKWDKSQFGLSIAIEMVRQGRNDGLSAEEIKLWPEGHAHARRVKDIIASFDRVPEIANQKGKIMSLVLVEFIKWARVGQDNEKAFYGYFSRQYKEAGGRYDLPGWNAVSAERKNRRDCGITDDDNARSFEKRLERLPIENDASSSEKGYIDFPRQAI